MRGSLRVTPGANSYGGQLVVFSGDMGSGQQRIFLQRRGSPSAAWADVIDPRTGKNFTRLTNRDGSFRFEFPAPAMNYVYFRLHSRKADTPAHLFKSKHQDADISLIESTPADVPLPRGFAVVSEKFRIAVDTADHDRSGKPTKPILVGRVVTLQVRSGDAWKSTGITGTVGRDGRLNFGEEARGVPGTEVYRVVMEDWTGDGDRVGWFPSVPFYLEVVRRPLPVRGLDADETAVGQAELGAPRRSGARQDRHRAHRGGRSTPADRRQPQPRPGDHPGRRDVVHRLHGLLVLDLQVRRLHRERRRHLHRAATTGDGHHARPEAG